MSGLSYGSSFPLTENPISEGGKWVNGLATGLLWHNVRSDGTKAYGTQTGANGFDDSVATMAGVGSWDPTQVISAKVKTANRITSGITTHVFQEVELLLRFTIGANSATGYECTFSVDPFNEYIQINRWNGTLGGFTLIASASAALDTVSDGDIIKATICGKHITVYVNDVMVVEVDDTTYSTGSPGIGFYYTNDGTTGTAPFLVSDFGLTDVAASNFKWAYSACNLFAVASNPGASTWVAGSLSATPPAGAKVIAAIMPSLVGANIPRVTGITDSSGRIWVQDVNPFTNNNGSYCEAVSWWSCIAGGAAINSITVAFSPSLAANAGIAIAATAFGGLAGSGPAGVDFSVAANDTASPMTSGVSSGTTDRADELKVAVIFDAGNNGTITLSTPDTFTSISKVDNSSASEVAMAYGPAGVAGATTQATFTATVNADSMVSVVVFRSIEPTNSVRESHKAFPRMNMRTNELRPRIR